SVCQVLRPVRMLARHGLHFGFDVKQCLNRMPSRAMRSKFGVLTQVQPYAPACVQFQSSKMMNRMFGFGGEPGASATGVAAAAPAGARADSSRARGMVSRVMAAAPGPGRGNGIPEPRPRRLDRGFITTP